MNLKEFKMEIKMSTKPKKPVMPDFENIQVSTKTYKNYLRASQ